MPSGNLQIANATEEDAGPYKCAAYNPVTQEVKTSASADRLRVRRESPAHTQRTRTQRTHTQRTCTHAAATITNRWFDWFSQIVCSQVSGLARVRVS